VKASGTKEGKGRWGARFKQKKDIRSLFPDEAITTVYEIMRDGYRWILMEGCLKITGRDGPFMED